MRTEQAKTRGGKPHTGIFWKIWAVREGENRQLYVCYRANGKLRWEKVPTNSIRDAQSLRRSRLREASDGDYIDPSKGRITLAVVADRWIESLSCKPQSVMRYRAWLSGHINPRVGSRELRSLRPEDVETFAAQLRDQLGPSSCRQAVGVLKRILKASVRWGYLKTSPAEAAQPQFAPQRRQEIKPLSRREVREFLSHVQANRPHWYPFFLTAISTGMRVGELMAMKWEHLDEDAATYHVRETLTRDRRFDLTKTPESEAKVPVSPAVLSALRDHRIRQATIRLRKRNDYPNPEIVFPNSLGGPLDYASLVYKVFKPLLAEAGIREIRFHDLRHTCASLMISNGESIKAVQRQLRHATIQITLDTYSHLYPEDRAAASHRLDALLVG